MSLLETLLVLVVTTLLIGGTVASITSARSALILRLESDRLRLTIERAYALALAGDMNTHLLVQRDRVSLSRGSEVVVAYRPSRGIVFETPPHLNGLLSFYPSHAASPATITIRVALTSCTVTISLRGRVRTTC